VELLLLADIEHSVDFDSKQGANEVLKCLKNFRNAELCKSSCSTELIKQVLPILQIPDEVHHITELLRVLS
jgi:hypothetical protein